MKSVYDTKYFKLLGAKHYGGREKDFNNSMSDQKILQKKLKYRNQIRIS